MLLQGVWVKIMLSLNTSQICGNWCSLNWLSTIYANKSFHLYHKTYRDQENYLLLLLILILATEVDWADKISYTNGLPSPFLLPLLLLLFLLLLPPPHPPPSPPPPPPHYTTTPSQRKEEQCKTSADCWLLKWPVDVQVQVSIWHD